MWPGLVVPWHIESSGPGFGPTSPALAGGFSTTGPQGSPCNVRLNLSQYIFNYFATSRIRKGPYNKIFFFKLASFVLLSFFLLLCKDPLLVLSGVSTSHFVQFYSFIWQFNILIPSWSEQVVPVAVLQFFFFF